MVAKVSARVAHIVIPVLLLAVILSAPVALAQQFVKIDVPNSTATLVLGINNSSQMAGAFVDQEGITHGFMLSAGTFTTLDFPGATFTQATDINNSGQVVGNYLDDGGVVHGFTWKNGVFNQINDPGFTGTSLSALSDIGQFVGVAIDSNNNKNGFLLQKNVFTTIDFPNANFTELLGIPFQGTTIVGVYNNNYPFAQFHGMQYSNGQFTTVDFRSGPCQSGTSCNTSLNGINDGGQVLGTYSLVSQPSVSHPFLITGGTFSAPGALDFPGAVSTQASNLNDSAQVVGAYVDASNNTHGYLMTNGPFAYVANINSGTVSMIDISTQLAVNSIPVGNGPWGVAVAPSGKQVYVTNNHGNNVSVIDVASSTVVATIPVQLSPFGVTFTPDGTSAYVVNGSSNSVSVIDTASQTVVNTVPVQSSPVGVGMALTSNGTFAYVTNSGANTVSVIAVGPNPSVVQTINVGTGPRWVAVAPNSSLAYVENAGSNNVSVISVANNNVTATIPVGMAPFGAAFSPDSTMAYVANSGSNSVSVIVTASSSVAMTINGFNNPAQVALTADGAFAYVTNLNANTVSVVTTATNTITDTVPVGSAPIGIAMASAPPTTLQITQILNPMLPNVFNFGTNNQQVQYPSGTQFNNVNMTMVATQMTQADFAQQIAGSPFAGATCIVYSGNGGNCVEYQVSCTDNNQNPITCPSENQPTIGVQSGFASLQSVINPGYLYNPLPGNSAQWQNIFSSYMDPTVSGKTKGFGGGGLSTPNDGTGPSSTFIAVSLGATNAQGEGLFIGLPPLLFKNFRTFPTGTLIPARFRLTSLTTHHPVTDATAGLTVVQIRDAQGNPVSNLVLSAPNSFVYQASQNFYLYNLDTTGYAPGIYNITVWGDAFPTGQVPFRIVGDK